MVKWALGTKLIQLATYEHGYQSVPGLAIAPSRKGSQLFNLLTSSKGNMHLFTIRCNCCIFLLQFSV